MVDPTRVTRWDPVRGRGVRGTLRMALWLAGVVVALLASVPAVAQATDPAAKYDQAGQQHNNVCVKLARGLSQTDLHYLSGVGTGFFLPKSALAFTDGSCGTGQLRLDLHEIVPAPSTINGGPNPVKQLVFHRGGSGYVDSQNVRYGQVSTSDLSQSTTWLNRHVTPSGDNRGAACTTLPGSYKVSVQPIPYKMKYKSPQMVSGGNNAGASYLHYGDPAAQQGDQDLDQPPTSSPYPQRYSTSITTIHYSTLTWSWIDVGGGGMNRILLAPDQDIRLCDVDPIDYPSWAPSSDAPQGQVNGQVEARYVETSVGDGQSVFGWMVWTHQYYYDDAGNYIGQAAPVVNHFTTG
jgi:hypothetical protein